jgi:Bacteriophage protein gp37
MGKTKIEWTDRTWNPVIGCQKNSPECDNCYAAELAQSARMQQFPQYQEVKNWDKAVFVRNQLIKPLTWKEPSMIFLSMGDLFFHTIADEEIDEIFAIVALTQRHTYQFLTKFPIRAEKYFSNCRNRLRMKIVDVGRAIGIAPEIYEVWETFDFDDILPNLWLGTSTGLQNSLDNKVPWLLKTRATLKFLSCEPLLEPLNLRKYLGLCSGCQSCQFTGNHQLSKSGISWVIVGGESGSKARPCNLDWIRSIVNQCRQANVPVFVKQLGAIPIESTPYIDGVAQNHFQLNLKDRKGGDISEFPEDLRIRQFPVN